MQLTAAAPRPAMSPEERQTRIDLAAAYRLVAHYGWDDLIFTHISARVPGPDHHFLINPRGTNLTGGQRVRIIGNWNSDGTFNANEIDVVGSGYRY